MKTHNKLIAKAAAAVVFLALAATARANQITGPGGGSASWRAGWFSLDLYAPGVSAFGGGSDVFSIYTLSPWFNPWEAGSPYTALGADPVFAYVNNDDNGGAVISYGSYVWDGYSLPPFTGVDVEGTPVPGQCGTIVTAANGNWSQTCSARVSAGFSAQDEPPGHSISGDINGTGAITYSGYTTSGPEPILMWDGFDVTFTGTATVNPHVPEPSSLLLLGILLLTGLWTGRRQFARTGWL